MTGAISRCQQLVDKTPDAFCLQQFENPANPEVHYKTTGPEIWRDTAGRVDYLVAGIPLLLSSPVHHDDQVKQPVTCQLVDTLAIVPYNFVACMLMQ